MDLTVRLKTIASFIKKGEVVYDIGCDHALLDIFLTLYNENKCYACDINKSALSNAYQNIKKYHLTDKIDTICSNGLDEVEVKKNSTMVISGMGTSTILEILKNPKIENIDTFIIQSNNDHFLLRKEIAKMNLKIMDEVIVCEKGIYYLILKVIHGKAKYSKQDLEFGPLLKKDNSLDTLLYYQNMMDKKIAIIKKMPGKYLGKKLKLLKEITWLKHTLKKNHFKERK